MNLIYCGRVYFPSCYYCYSVVCETGLFSHIELGKHILASSEKCEGSTNNKLIYSIVLLICLQKRTSNHLSGPETGANDFLCSQHRN